MMGIFSSIVRDSGLVPGDRLGQCGAGTWQAGDVDGIGRVRRNGLNVTDITGLTFDLLADEWRTSNDVSVNYIMFAEKD